MIIDNEILTWNIVNASWTTKLIFCYAFEVITSSVIFQNTKITTIRSDSKEILPVIFS